VEYYFIRDNKISPYGLFEIGTNFFDKKVEGKTALLNSQAYDSFDNMPEANRSHSSKALDTSFRLALGAGTKYNLTQYIGLDLRFVYQFNAAIGNNSQLLMGIVF
jgi:opacity protein-like surface antigen